MNDSASYCGRRDLRHDAAAGPSGGDQRRRPSTGSSSNPVSTDPTATFSEAVVPSTVSFTLKDPNGNTVPGTTSFNSADTVATFTPASSLAAGTTYTATISGATGQLRPDDDGAVHVHVHHQQGVRRGGQVPVRHLARRRAVWCDRRDRHRARWSWASSSRPPERHHHRDPVLQGAGQHRHAYRQPVEFHRDAAGDRDVQQRVRPRAGRSWTSPARCRSPRGRPTSPPITPARGTTPITSNGLTSAVTNGPLTALANGGVYAYGSSSTFPSNSFNASNYWVDVVYTTASGVVTPVVSSVTPGSGSSGNPVSVAPTATFSQAVVPSTVSFTLKDSGREHGRGSVSFRQHRHGGHVHAHKLAGGGHHLHGDGVGGPEQFRHDDEQPLLVELHHRGVPVPVQHLAATAQPSVASASDTSSVNLGVEFTADCQRVDHRHPLLQGRGQHRHPHRQPVDHQRDPARPGDLHQRVRDRAGRRRTSRPRSR